MALQVTVSPHSQLPYVSRTYPTEQDLDAVISRAHDAQKAWGRVPVVDRVAIGRRFMVSTVHTLTQIGSLFASRTNSGRCPMTSP